MIQIKIFTVPIHTGERQLEDLNAFLRSKKILEIDRQFVAEGINSFWCFSVQYTDAFLPDRTKPDYKILLEEEVFNRFSKMRQLRKQIAQDEGVPPYAVFTDEELSELAKHEVLTLTAMQKVKGIGEKKIEKYAKYFLEKHPDEKN